ncbi:hypothetical protein Tco_0871121 [Tanacetum coccineum]
MACSNCFQKGHNKSGCKNQTVLLPPKPLAKKGKPRKNPIPYESVDDQTKPLVPPSVPIPPVEEHLVLIQLMWVVSRSTVQWLLKLRKVSDSIKNTQEETMHDSEIQESQTVQTAPTQSSQTAASDGIAVDNQVMPFQRTIPKKPNQ